MNKCKKCGINVLDHTIYCPLCKSVLESDSEDDICISNMYPDVSKKYKLYRFILKLIIFVSVLIEGILIVINAMTYDKIAWSAITGGALFYTCFSLVYSVRKNVGHREKIVVQAAVLMIYLVVVDYALGFKGWSYGIALPIIVMIIEAGICVLMIFNKKGWQNYIVMQIFMIITCAWLLVMYAMGKSNFIALSAIATAIAVALFAGTIMFGDSKATNELSRRFRI